MFVLSILIGIIVLFFFKHLTIIGPLISGFIAGIVAKGPISGLIAGIFVGLIGAAIFSLSSITAFSIVDFMNISHLKPVASTFEHISLILISFGGFLGGLIRRF